MAPEHASISLDNISHAFKAARPAPPSVAIFKKPSRSETATLTRRIPVNTPKRKVTFHHFGVPRKRTGLRGERQLTSSPD